MKHFKRYAVYFAIAAMTTAAAGLGACSTIDDPTPGNPTLQDVDSEELAIDFSVDNMLMGSMAGSTRADGDENETGSGDGTESTEGGSTTTGGSSTTEGTETDADGHPAHSAEAHEKRVNHVYFLFFDKNHKFLAFQRSEVKEGDTKVTFPVPSTLEPTTDDSNPIEYDVIIAANVDYYPPVGYATFSSFLNSVTKGKTLTQVQEVLSISTDHTMNKNVDEYLPMMGYLKDGNGNDLKFSFKIVEGRYVSNGAILFKRQVARIDLNNYAIDDLDIDWVKVCNYRSTTMLWRDDYTKGTVEPGINDDAPSVQAPYYIPVDDATTGTSGVSSQKVNASLYAFPNSVEKPSQDDAVTTYLMIAAHYKGSEELQYYRFNLNQGTSSQFLEKNHIYTANIMGVRGPGAQTESAARLTNAPVLIATVEETWEDDDVNSDADASGNFIILSKTSITFDGNENLKQTITVKVRQGMEWTLEEVNSTGNSNSDFSHSITKKDDDASGTITFTTLAHNNTNFVKYGYFKVVGKTKDGKLLTVNINIQQLSVNDDVKMLTVNGQTGTITPRVSGTGTTLLYQVQTGSMTNGWTAYPVDSEGKRADNLFTPWGANGASYTHEGGNKGYLEIVIPANITGAERDLTLKVVRNGVTEEEVPPVYVRLEQPKSKILLSVYPYPQNGIMELEGFLDETKQTHLNNTEERTNSFSTQKDIFVTLADPVEYQYMVETNIDGSRDMTLSPNKAILRNQKMGYYDLTSADDADTSNIGPKVECTGTQKYTRHPNYQKLENMQNGEKFYMNVLRTGPGDPDIVGTIKITAYPKDGYTGETQTLSFDIRIVTSCEIADVVIYHSNNSTMMLVADRNVGAVSRLNGTTYNRALNYSAVSNMHITNSTVNTDFDNKLYSGGYYTWNNINTENGGNNNDSFKVWVKENYYKYNQDPNQLTSPFYTEEYKDSWCVPNNDYLKSVWYRLQWSKQRPYLVSILKHNGKYMGCYIPCAGMTNNTSTSNAGYYQTSQYNNGTYMYIKSLNGVYGYYNESAVKVWSDDQSNYDRNHALSVRCIIPGFSASQLNIYKEWLEKH